MILEKIVFPKENEPFNRELIVQDLPDGETKIGTVFLKKGSRIPDEGFSIHALNEVSFILKGHIEMVNEANEVINNITAGTVAFIPSNEPHAGNVLEDTEIVYVLF